METLRRLESSKEDLERRRAQAWQAHQRQRHLEQAIARRVRRLSPCWPRGTACSPPCLRDQRHELLVASAQERTERMQRELDNSEFQRHSAWALAGR